MKKIVTIEELKELIGSDTVFETESGFIVNMFGKYLPNITFVLGREVQLDGTGKPVSPVQYMDIPSVAEGTNLNFDGDIGVLFGDFWRSKKGGACFRPCELPTNGQHMLLGVSWGGAFSRTRGLREAPAGALYFRRASSNGGGAGRDFLVLPVGYHLVLDKEGNRLTPVIDRKAKYIMEADLAIRFELEKADATLKAKIAAEQASMAAKEMFLPRLKEIQTELKELSKPKEFGRYSIPELRLGESSFKLGWNEKLYDDAGMSFVEKELYRLRDWVLKEESEKKAKAEAEATFRPQFEALISRCEAVGWTIEFTDSIAKVRKPETIRYCFDTGVSGYAFTEGGVRQLRKELDEAEDKKAEKEAAKNNAERIRKVLSGTGLPEELWFAFEGTEAVNAEITKAAEAIVQASAAVKDEMDMHELCNCGFDRRCGAIRRQLERCGCSFPFNMGGQSGSRALAYFIAGC